MPGLDGMTVARCLGVAKDHDHPGRAPDDRGTSGDLCGLTLVILK